MDVENIIIKIVPDLLRVYDKNKQGVAIDVGVGTFNFYFKTFAESGYDTFAIEPLPSDLLLSLFKRYKKVKHIEACLLDKEGQIEIFTGTFNNEDCTDVSSINRDWWGVSEKSSSKMVNCITLQHMISEYNIQEITYFKVDTEGSEYSILSQLNSIDFKFLPKIIEFEYGGGSTKKEKIGGWDDKYFSGTVNTISLLASLGYKYLLLFERENEKIKEFILDENTNPSSIFEDYFVYGDIIMLKERRYEIDNGSIKFNLNQFDFLNKLKRIFE